MTLHFSRATAKALGIPGTNHLLTSGAVAEVYPGSQIKATTGVVRSFRSAIAFAEQT